MANNFRTVYSKQNSSNTVAQCVRDRMDACFPGSKYK